MKRENTTLENREDEISFVKEAAAEFAKRPNVTTFSRKFEPGEFLAIRWGLSDRGVMVVRLAGDHTPTNYRDAVLHAGV